jgi:anti-sigma regulatory factor (Ser/Thr protein kinase)
MGPIRLPAVVESLDEVVRYVRELAENAALAPDRAYWLRLAVEELVVNVVVHNKDERCELEIEGGVEPHQVWLRIVDTAAPFDPTTDGGEPEVTGPLNERKPGGLGLFLARWSVDRLAYEYTHGHNRTTLVVSRAPD